MVTYHPLSFSSRKSNFSRTDCYCFLMYSVGWSVSQSTIYLLSIREMLGLMEGRDTATWGKRRWSSEGNECSPLKGAWLRRVETSGSGRLKIKGSSSGRKDPEVVRGRLEVQESPLVRSHVCSITSYNPRSWSQSEQREVLYLSCWNDNLTKLIQPLIKMALPDPTLPY